MKKFFGLIISIYLIALVGYKAYTTFLVASPTDQASEILKQYLKSPASFEKTGGETLWTGKTKEDTNAYVVSISYNASNSFGALLKGCHFISYFETKEGKISWNPSYGVKDFTEMRQLCEQSTPIEIKQKMATTLADINFPKK